MRRRVPLIPSPHIELLAIILVICFLTCLIILVAA